MNQFYGFLIRAIIRHLYPQAANKVEEYLTEHPEIVKKTENILFIIIYATLFINIFVTLPFMIFMEYAFNHCCWDISKFNFISVTVIIILTILLFIDLIICKINFKIAHKEKINEIIERIYIKLSPLMDFMGRMLTCFIFISFMYFFCLIFVDIPSHKKYITTCSTNISHAHEMLFDTREKKIFRNNQTEKYTNNISDDFLNTWTPPKVKKNKSTEIIVRISKDGKLLKYEIQDSSGIEEFDKSVINVVNSKNFKPFPESLQVEYIDFMFGFEIYRQKKYVGEYQISCKTCENPYKDDWNFYKNK